MQRFVGVKHNKICLVSSSKLEANKDFQILEVPAELDKISNDELISNCIIKDGIIKYRLSKKSAKEMKVALVSNYGSKCGIGTYSKFLYDELVDLVGDYKIFTEKTTDYIIENDKIPSNKVIQCWKRGESQRELVKSIKEYDPDLILIQFEFGLYPNAAHWLALMSQLADYNVVITLHSIFPDHKDKIIVEAPMRKIIVHSNEAKDALLNKHKIAADISVINHGCFECIDKSKLWNYYKTSKTIIQFGFLLRYKNFEASIKAVSLLKNKYPDVFLTILGSINQHSKTENQIYFNELYQLIEDLNLQENVALIKGYQSENVIDTYLRCNNVALFPYTQDEKHICYGSSGAVPVVMSKGIPVVSSFAPHFITLPTIKAHTPQDMATELDKLFSDKNTINKQVEIQNKYLKENNWKNTALKYVEVFEK